MNTKQITDIKGGFTLHNGVTMPYFGLGTWQSKNGKEVIQSILNALEVGYRHIDTAAIYQNEEGVGKAIKMSDTKREEIFLVSKVWNSDQGFNRTLEAFDSSLKKLQTDYLDLYLIHWPVKGKFSDTWRAMEKLYEDGRVRAIGVSNFLEHHLEQLLKEAKIIPMVNQMEFHPRLVQEDLLEYCNQKAIQYEAWSPLMQGKIMGVEQLGEIADFYEKSIAQIVLRWNLQRGIVTIPKSVRKERIIENADLFNFELSDKHMSVIDSLDTHSRVGPDPDTFDF